jgi:hypothetical protein
VDPGHYYVFGQPIAGVAIAVGTDRRVRLPCDAPGRPINTRPLVLVDVPSYSPYLRQEPFIDPTAPYAPSALFYKVGFAFAAAALQAIIPVPLRRAPGVRGGALRLGIESRR